jgi:alpha,alpha-trehalase
MAATDSLSAVTVPHVLREYALLADGERGILVGPRGDFAWMCFPGWDGDGVFSSLIGGGGAYAVTPVARFVWGGYYEHPGLIWRSRWTCDDGTIVECREALAAPASPTRAVMLRRICAIHGTARARVLLDLRANFGHHHAQRLHRDEDGSWTAHVGDAYARWDGAADATPVTNGARGTLLELTIEIEAGAHHDLVLVLDTNSEAPLPDVERAWQGTEAYWREHVPALTSTVAPRDARHAYAVLQGLTSSGGGMVAAATTSLPERAEQGRNYDYRYVWIRDQCYAGQAIAKAGAHPLMDDAVRFVSQRLLEHGADLTPAYTTAGGRVPDEKHLDVPGYPGGQDIVGNHVNEQFQLDVFGEALLLFASAARHDHLDNDGWRAAEAAAAAIAARWTEPDAGIWELEPRNWTHSRLTCVAGLRAMAAARPGRPREGEWQALADRILAETAAEALSPDGHWQRSPDDPSSDGSLLLAGLRGALPADDPRTVATLRSYLSELTVQGYGYRFREQGRSLGDFEGAFQLCGFLTAMALHQQGDAVEAARWFERTHAACGPPQLFSEEYDPKQNQMRGNLAQGFVHAYMLEAAIRLNRPA